MNLIIRPRQLDYTKQFTKLSKVEEFYKIDGGSNSILEKNINPQVNVQSNIETVVATTTTTQKKKNQKEQEKAQIQNEKNFQNLNEEQKNQNLKNGANSKAYESIIIPELMVVQKKQQSDAEGGLLQKRRLVFDYIKIMRNQKNLPDNEAYELTNKDYEFIKKIKKQDNNEFSETDVTNFEKYFEIFEDEQDKKLIEKNELITLQQVKNAISERLLPIYQTYDIEAMYKYWESLRKLFKRELIRKFYKTSPDNPDPQMAFRPRLKTKTRRVTRALGTTSYNKMVQLKTELVQACNIMNMIKHREQMKSQIIECQNLQFDEQIKQDKNDGINNQQKWTQLFSQIKKEQETLKKKKKVTKPTSSPVFNPEQAQPQAPQPQVKPPVTQFSSDSKSFDIAAFLASIILEADKLELTQTNIKDLEALNKFHKKFQAKKQSQNQSPLKSNVMLPNNILSSPADLSLIKQPSQSMIPKQNDRQQQHQIRDFNQQPMPYQNSFQPQQQFMQNQQQAVTSKLIQYKLHKRLARANRVVIDRYLVDDDLHNVQIEHQKLNQKVKLIKINSLQIHPSLIEEEDEYDENDDIYSADTAATNNNNPTTTLHVNNNQDQNDMFRQKHLRFSSLYCFSDSEDEGAKQSENQDSNLKKQIRNSFLNFLKIKRKQRASSNIGITNSNGLLTLQSQNSTSNFDQGLLLQPEFSNQNSELITTNS